MTLKKTLAILMAAALMCLTFAGCSKKAPTPNIERFIITEEGMTSNTYYCFKDDGKFGAYTMVYALGDADAYIQASNNRDDPSKYAVVGTWRYSTEDHKTVEVLLTDSSEAIVFELTKEGLGESHSDDNWWLFKNKSNGKNYEVVIGHS